MICQYQEVVKDIMSSSSPTQEVINCLISSQKVTMNSSNLSEEVIICSIPRPSQECDQVSGSSEINYMKKTKVMQFKKNL